MTTTLAVDIDATPEPAPPQRQWLRYLPWALFALTAVALAASLLPRPVEPVLAAPPEPQKISTEMSDGIGENVWVSRDSQDRIATVVWIVRPYGSEEVWCRIHFDGVAVAEVTAIGGSAAVCVWIRG